MALEQEKIVTVFAQAIKRLVSKSTILPLAVLLFIGFLMSPKGWLLGAIDHEIEQFQVNGELKNLKTETIETTLSSWLGSSFLTSDLGKIKQDVESLAWVHRATVSRVWPGQIVLDLTEQLPVAYWTDGAFLNGEGEVFKPQNIATDRPLPVLVGPENSQQLLRAEMLAEMSQLQKLLEPYVLSAHKLEVNERGSWSMTLHNGINVALGSRPFESKIERLAKVLNSTDGKKKQDMESIDTRYPNGVAVKWKALTLASSEKQ